MAKIPAITDFEIINLATGRSFAIKFALIVDLKIEDKITPEYNETYAFGKFDPIVNWKNTKRTISVSFTVVEGSAANQPATIPDLVDNFAKITLPNYNAAEGAIYVQSGPIYKLNLFGYFNEFGIIKNLVAIPNYSPKKVFLEVGNTVDFESIGPGSSLVELIQTNVDGRRVDTPSALTKYSFKQLGVTFEFTVLHKTLPNENVPTSLVNWPFISG